MHTVNWRLPKETLFQLGRLALPIIVSQGAFALMIFTDRLYMSRLSPTHMAAALGGGVTWLFCTSLFTGLFSYVNTMVAQYYGAGNLPRCSQVANQGLLLALCSLPFLAVLIFLGSDLFTFMGHVKEQVALEETYFTIVMFGAPITFAKVIMSYWFTGIGRTRTVMIADISGVVINALFSYCLVFGVFGTPLGIKGAAFGNLTGTTLSLLIYAYFFFRRQNRLAFQIAFSWRWDRQIIHQFFSYGLPAGIETALNVAAFNVFLLMFQSFGVHEGAAAAIVFNWDILSFIPMMGLSNALTSLIGRSLATGYRQKVNEIIYAGFAIGLAWSFFTATMFVLFKEPMVDIFTTGQQEAYAGTRELALFMMTGLATYTMADAIILVTGGILRGAGDTRWLMMMSITLHWFMVLGEYLLIKQVGTGPKAPWIGFVVMIIVIALTYLGRLFSNRWRRPEVLLKRFPSETSAAA